MIEPIEKLVPEIVKALLALPVMTWDWYCCDPRWLWERTGPGKHDFGKTLQVEAVEADKEVKNIIASSPLWLASLVVGWIEERAMGSCDNLDYTFLDCPNKGKHIENAVSDFSISPSDYEEIKRRVG